MNYFKNALYTAFSVALAAVPAVASAQWGIGKSNAAASGLPDDTIYGIINRTMNWLLMILGFIGIIGFVIAGILYLTAAGDEDQIGKAKTAMMYSIIGIIVALMGFVIIRAVESWLSAGAFTF